MGYRIAIFYAISHKISNAISWIYRTMRYRSGLLHAISHAISHSTICNIFNAISSRYRMRYSIRYRMRISHCDILMRYRMRYRLWYSPRFWDCRELLECTCACGGECQSKTQVRKEGAKVLAHGVCRTCAPLWAQQDLSPELKSLFTVFIMERSGPH